MRHILTLAVFVTTSLTVLSADQPLVSAIRAAWDERAERTATIKLIWLESTLYPKGSLSFLKALIPGSGLKEVGQDLFPVQDTSFNDRATLWISHRKSRFEKTESLFDLTQMKFVEERLFAAHDGVQATHLIQKPSGNISTGIISGKPLNAGLSSSSWPLCVYFRGLHRSFANTPDLEEFTVALDAARPNVVLLKISRDETGGEKVVALDAANGYSPLWIEIYKRTGELFVKCTVTKTSTINVFRLPTEWTCTEYHQRKLLRQTRCVLESFDMMSPTETIDYRVRFPKGTHINDQTEPGNARNYVVSEDERRIPVKGNEIAQTVQALEEGNIIAAKESSNRWIFVITVIIFGMLVVLGITLRKFRYKGKLP